MDEGTYVVIETRISGKGWTQTVVARHPREELWAAIVRLQSATDWYARAHGRAGTEEQMRLREREVREMLGLDAPA